MVTERCPVATGKRRSPCAAATTTSGGVQGDLYKNASSAASIRFDHGACREGFNKAAELAWIAGKSSEVGSRSQGLRGSVWVQSGVFG